MNGVERLMNEDIALASVTSKKILMNGIVPSILKGESETELTASVLKKKDPKHGGLISKCKKNKKKALKV